VDIQIQVKGVDELVRNLRDLGVNRIPNYVARSLTMLAECVQDSMEAETREHLTVRGTWLRKGTRYGINRIAATKGNLTATVWTQAGWLIAEEQDDVRRPVGGRQLAVPLASIRPGRLNPEVLSVAKKPRNFPRAFLMQTKSGPMIMQRQGKGPISSLVPLYALKRQVPIPRRVHLIQAASKTINEMYQPVMTEMIQSAIQEGKA